MAQPIQSIVRPVKTDADREAERLEDIRKETAHDAEGLIEGLKLLQAMKDRGLLELLVALFDRGDQVMSKLVDILATPGASNAIQLALSALQALGQIDAQAVSKSLTGVAAGMDNMVNAPARSKPMGVFELMRQLKDPDVNAAISVGLDFLKGVGQSIRTEGLKEHS